jgi:hypothetical protein
VIVLLLFQTADFADRCKIRHDEIPRKVVAFYYPWYGNPKVSGSWVHWEGAREKDIASSTHYPELGPYDSHDPKIVEKHCAWAKEAGIDVLVSSWWGRGDFTDRALPRILDAAKARGLEVTVYYEQVRNAREEFRYLVDTYGAHPAWFKVGGKPVVFVYVRAMGQLGLLEWAGSLAGVFAVADQMDRPAARVFDGLHTYNPAGDLAGRKLEEVGPAIRRLYAPSIERADRYGRASCVTVIPGYDDTKIRKPGLRVDRFGGDSYRRQWEAAIELDPHWVAITSFNEWHEGSEIEPSAEFGDAYLRITAEYAAKFKSAPRKKRAPAKEPSVRIAFDHRVAVLPGARSEAAWRLLEAGVKMDFDVRAPDAKTHRLALYASGELYPARELDGPLAKYLESGGYLLAAPAEPFPFYYEERGRAVAAASKFGLRIGMGFESPSGRFHFRWKDRTIPFPEAGDRRWRPCEGEALVELRDGDRSLGGAVVVGDRAAYLWFRIPDLAEGDAILAEVMKEIAGRLK